MICLTGSGITITMNTIDELIKKYEKPLATVDGIGKQAKIELLKKLFNEAYKLGHQQGFRDKENWKDDL